MLYLSTNHKIGMETNKPIDNNEATMLYKFYDQTFQEGAKIINEVAKQYLQIFTASFTLIVTFREKVFYIIPAGKKEVCSVSSFLWTSWASLICWIIAIIFALLVIFPFAEAIERNAEDIAYYYKKMIFRKKSFISISTIAFILALVFIIIDTSNKF